MKLKNLILPLLLASCSLGDHPQMVTYTVNKVDTQPNQCKVTANLQIVEPTVAPGLDSQRIAVMKSDEQIDYYASVKWAAPISEMLQKILVDSFEHAGSFASVNTEAETIHNDMVLLTDIRDYQVTDQTTGKIHIRGVAKLVSAKDRKVLATIPFEKEASPDAVNMASIISAFNNASSQAVNDIVSGSLSSLPKCKTK